MVTEEGQIVAIEAQKMIVAVLKTSACQSCQARQACGQAVLNNWRDETNQAAYNHFALPLQKGLAIGDGITLGIQEDTLTLAALWVYLLPLVTAFVALIGLNTLGASEPIQLLAAIGSAWAACLLTRRRFNSVNKRFLPKIIAHQPTQSALIARTD